MSILCRAAIYLIMFSPSQRSACFPFSTASAFPKPSQLSVKAGQGLKVYPEAERAAEGETHTPVPN